MCRVLARTFRRYAHDEEMPVRDLVLRVACLVLVALGAACTGPGPDNASPIGADATGERDGAEITVGSFDFPESVLLAHVYAKALVEEGFSARVVPELGSRELVGPALMKGLVQVVPEYTGSAADFLSLGELPATSDVNASHRALQRVALRRGLVAGQPAPAQDANAIVVTAATAARYHLGSISDLSEVAEDLVFGGPPECRKRPYCLPGLRQTYGLRFKGFAPTDAGGPLTLQALVSSQIGVGLLFTSDPSIQSRNLVILRDDRSLQPAENITPLVHRDTVARYGPRLLATIDAVSARLSTDTLRRLNARVQLDREDPGVVAGDWLRSQETARTAPEAP